MRFFPRWFRRDKISIPPPRLDPSANLIHQNNDPSPLPGGQHLPPQGLGGIHSTGVNHGHDDPVDPPIGGGGLALGHRQPIPVVGAQDDAPKDIYKFPAGKGPQFLGPPVHQGGGTGPEFLGPPVPKGVGQAPHFVGPPIQHGGGIAVGGKPTGWHISPAMPPSEPNEPPGGSLNLPPGAVPKPMPEPIAHEGDNGLHLGQGGKPNLMVSASGMSNQIPPGHMRDPMEHEGDNGLHLGHGDGPKGILSSGGMTDPFAKKHHDHQSENPLAGFSGDPREGSGKV